jgi:hypothetical protein
MTKARTIHEDLFANDEVTYHGIKNLATQTIPRNSTGMSGGYVIKLSEKLPSIKRANDL